MGQRQDTVRVAIRALSPYVGKPIATAALLRICERLDIRGERISDDQVEQIIRELGPRLHAFVGHRESMRIAQKIRATKDPLPPRPVAVPRGRAVDIATALLLLGTCALFLPQLWVDGYRDTIGVRTLLWVGSPLKMACLAAGAIYAFQISRRFQRSNPGRLPWLALSVFLGFWFAGQSGLGYYQLVLNEPTPFPSAGDLFFQVGYPILLFSFVAFIRAYHLTGLIRGEPRGYVVLAAVFTIVLLGVALIVLTPIVKAGAPPLETFLNLSYPILDMVALVPTLILVTIAARLRGGSVFWVWAALLSGFVAIFVGDVLYAYFSALGEERLDPLLDVMYVAGYLLIARGVLKQYDVVTTN